MYFHGQKIVIMLSGACLPCPTDVSQAGDQEGNRQHANKNELLASKFNSSPDILFGTNGETTFADNPLCEICKN